MGSKPPAEKCLNTPKFLTDDELEPVLEPDGLDEPVLLVVDELPQPPPPPPLVSDPLVELVFELVSLML